MAHPDEGYLISDEDWGGLVDPITGEQFYPDDPWGPYRSLLLQVRSDEQNGVARIDRERRLEQLARLKDRAARGLLPGQPEKERK
jgi:hypothetical protein